MKKVIVLLLLLGTDYWIDQDNRIIFGRTPKIVNEICFMRGGAFFGKNGRRLVWADGCHDPWDDVMILPLEARSPEHYIHRHELKHRLDGAWHD
ncbi:MAG: hypothetical protein Q7R69_00745 [bacterium]|nr:hypothetical protein [bacterium]